MTWLKIEDVAKETGLTKRTIRFYEEIGLIPPPERTDGGIRLYTENDIKFLKRVIDAKEVLGFSLQELQYFLQLEETIETHSRDYHSSMDCTNQTNELTIIQEGLSQQLSMLKAKIEKMKAFEKEIQELYQKVEEILSKDTSPNHPRPTTKIQKS
jgi:MerR family transcriptional regulator, repressor of the yfmOP operon